MITVNVPRDLLLTANHRHHWSKKARATRTLRQLGMYLAKQSDTAPMERARLEVTIHWPNRQRRDAHNLAPTVKALVDGMTADAGLLPDDDDTHLIGPDLRVSEDLCDKRFAAVLIFDWQPIEVTA